jgi:hypothetical protein
MPLNSSGPTGLSCTSLHSSRDDVSISLNYCPSSLTLHETRKRRTQQENPSGEALPTMHSLATHRVGLRLFHAPAATLSRRPSRMLAPAYVSGPFSSQHQRPGGEFNGDGYAQHTYGADASHFKHHWVTLLI